MESCILVENFASQILNKRTSFFEDQCTLAQAHQKARAKGKTKKRKGGPGDKRHQAMYSLYIYDRPSITNSTDIYLYLIL